MNEKITFKLVAVKGDVIVYETLMSYVTLGSFISNCSDSQEYSALFELASLHPSTQVREQVAYKDQLNETTVSTLTKDNSINVLRNLVRSTSFKQIATEDELLRLIDLDSELAISIAQNIETFENIVQQKVIDKLLASSDPAVAAALAGNYSTNRKILKSLIIHEDTFVADEAKKRLEE
jgi:hypothetical protein